MKTVKDVSLITGISIRTLRYYDKVGLLKPTQLTAVGYRLYDSKALEKLQQIMFYRELEIPLKDIKKIMEKPNYCRKQALLTQKSLLERKRNRLNGIIELIENVIEGVDTMNFEAFNDEDIKKIIDHSLSLMENESYEAVLKKYGSIEAFRAFMEKNLKDENLSSHLIKIYGSKDRALEASLQATGDKDCFKEQQTEIDKIYRQFSLLMNENSEDLTQNAVEQLAKNYKEMFKVDNARFLLLEVAKDYLNSGVLVKVTDEQYGIGVTEYIGHAIQRYYGV